MGACYNGRISPRKVRSEKNAQKAPERSDDA